MNERTNTQIAQENRSRENKQFIEIEWKKKKNKKQSKHEKVSMSMQYKIGNVFLYEYGLELDWCKYAQINFQANKKQNSLNQMK